MIREISFTEGRYSCTDKGEIISNERWVWNGYGYYKIPTRVLKPYKNNKGYLMVSLSVGNVAKDYLVHRLVAITWLDNPQNFTIINHKDNNPLNNCIDNLEWCDYSYNNQYAWNNGRELTQKNKDAFHKPKTYLYKKVNQYSLEGEYIATYDSLTNAGKAVAPHNNNAKSNIQACCKGIAKTA